MYVCDELGFIPQANATRFCCHINLISPIEEVIPEWCHLFFVFPLLLSSSPSVILETDFIIFDVLLSNIIPLGRDSDGA